MSSSQDAYASLWSASTAAGHAWPTLDRDIDADVAIVGGGYSGLSAAHYLAECGVRPVLLEAREIGWGASGRNGGVVSAKYRVSYSTMAKRFGMETARQMHWISHQAVDQVESLVERFDLGAAEFARAGNLRCAHNQRLLRQISDDAAWQTRELGDAHLRVLSAAEVAEETGSQAFVGGVLAADVGRLRPLAYARGLATALAGQGDDLIFEHTPVQALERTNAGVTLHTPGGTVRARQAIIASNGYSSLTPATRTLQRRVVPFRSAIIATAPLPDALDRKLLAERRSYGETRRMMRWFRRVDDRFVFGGRGAFGTEDSDAAFEALRRAMVSLFPDLADVAIDYRWSGHVAMTMDKFPHVGRLDDRLSCCLGYNGAGVALSTLLGRYAAAFALGETPAVGLLDAARLKRIPFYPLRELGVRAVAGWYQILDAAGL